MYNKDKLEFFLNNNQYDIVILSEIFKCENYFKILNYNIIYKTRSDGYGGVALLFKKGIKFRQINYDTQYDILIAKTTNLKHNIKIVATYFPPNAINNNDFEQIINNLFSFLEREQDVFIAGDMNARCIDFGDSVDKSRGTMLKHLIDQSEYKLLNNGSPTFVNLQGTTKYSSVLDITLTNSIKEIRWKTLDTRITASHHLPIHIEMEIVQQNISNFICTKTLKVKLKKVNIQADIHNITDTIQEEIRKCTINISNRTPKGWWNSETEKYFKIYKAAFQKANKFTSPENIKDFLEKKTEMAKCFKNSQK